MNPAVKKFLEQVHWLHEAEYGDFKRKVGLYIERLEEANPELQKGLGQRVMAEMKTQVLYNPSGDIESTRRQIMQLANELSVL